MLIKTQRKIICISSISNVYCDRIRIKRSVSAVNECQRSETNKNSLGQLLIGNTPDFSDSNIGPEAGSPA
jgi:hypothetical protein